MWIAPKDTGFKPRFERRFAYGGCNCEIVARFQMKSDAEKIEYENKLRKANPDKYEMFKYWCRHHGFLKEFYHYEDPVYISFEGEEWENLVEESRKAKTNEEKIKILKRYSKLQPFLPAIEEKEENTKTINEILKDNGFDFRFEKLETTIWFEGKFIFKEKIIDEDTKLESWVFQDQLFSDDVAIITPESKNEAIKYISSLHVFVYDENGLCIKSEER